MYILADKKRNCKKSIFIYVETKTTFETFKKKKILFFNIKDFIFYILKILYFISTSVKCICCRIYDFQKKV